MGDGSVRDGILRGIETGYFHREIQDSSYEYQERVERGEEVVVGVNEYTVEEDTRPDILKVDEEVQRKQLDRLASVKEERDSEAVEAALTALSAAIEDDENIMPYIVDAVKEYATIGEVMGVFEDHHGAYQETMGVV